MYLATKPSNGATVSDYAFVISPDHRTQIFGVELGRERRRAYKVDEHLGELAALGVVLSSWLGRRRRRGCRYGEIADRAQHFQPVPKRDAKIFEMLFGQFGKDGNIDLVFGKTLGLLGHAEFFEPIRNLLHGSHQTVPSWHDRVSATAEVILIYPRHVSCR
jgi:hypothetical protein